MKNIIIIIFFSSTTMYIHAQEKPKKVLNTTTQKINATPVIQTTEQKKVTEKISTTANLSQQNYAIANDGEYSIIPLKLPGSSTEKNYYVKKYGNKLYLNGDIIVHDFGLLSTKSYTRDDETYTFGKNDLYRWPGAVLPVVLESSVFESTNYLIIKSALDYFNFNTGIICKERTDEKDYIVIKCVKDNNSDKAGASVVGRQRNGNNILELINGSFTMGTVLHELMHALGVYHEQSRTDRDNYVNILWNNVREDSKYNFQVEGDGTVRSAYDYCSIMQYNTNAFAKDKSQPTIVCKTNGAIVACPACIGNRASLSPMDIDGLDKLYSGIGISRSPCNIPFVSSKVPIAGCSGLTDNMIRAKWDYYRNVLGDCQTDASFNGSSYLLYAQFQNGVIYHTSLGVFAVYGDIYKLFKSQNAVAHFGFPLNDETDIKDAAKGPLGSWQKVGYTRISKFEKGVIIWGPGKGAKELSNEKFAEGPSEQTIKQKNDLRIIQH
ncbi:MAG: M12 family metallopeptidase [Ferruginibacter sp.]